MDKEKIIEEMTKDIPAEMKDPYQGSDITVLYSYQIRKQIARYLVSKNYRKIPEGSVVLSKEEYEKLRRMPNFLSIDFTRKETAREILKMLEEHGIDKDILATCGIYDVNGVTLAKEISEKYGVEME